MVPFDQAFSAGFDRLAAWSDLLDTINVFPVADGDTGRNLVVSLAPLKGLSLIHISEPTRPPSTSRMPSSA